MNHSTLDRHRVHRAIHCLARIGSLAAIAFVLLIFVGEALSPGTAATPTPAEWIGLLLFPGGVCLGMILAWRRPGLGGVLTVASLVAFYGWNWAVRGRFPIGPYSTLIAAPGFLFLVHWLLSR